jgi:hypothetical protein
MYSRYRRRRPVRGLLVFVAGVLVLMVIGLAINAKLDTGRQPEAFPPTSLPVPPWDVTTPPSPAAAAIPAPSGPVRIIEGTQLVSGVYLGFPRSTAGAVSAAAEFTSVTPVQGIQVRAGYSRSRCTGLPVTGRSCPRPAGITRALPLSRTARRLPRSAGRTCNRKGERNDVV